MSVLATVVTAGFATVAATSASAETNAQYAFNFFRAKGLTGVQSAGIVGNFDEESGVNPSRLQNGARSLCNTRVPGVGLAQWSCNGRWLSLEGHEGCRAYTCMTMNKELDFAWWEFTHGYSYWLSQLKRTNNISTATQIIEWHYEIPNVRYAATNVRVGDATWVLAAYGASAVGGGSGTPTVHTVSCTTTVDQPNADHACGSVSQGPGWRASGCSVSMTGGGTYVLSNAPETSTTWTFTGLKPNEVYQVRVYVPGGSSCHADAPRAQYTISGVAQAVSLNQGPLTGWSPWLADTDSGSSAAITVRLTNAGNQSGTSCNGIRGIACVGADAAEVHDTGHAAVVTTSPLVSGAASGTPVTHPSTSVGGAGASLLGVVPATKPSTTVGVSAAPVTHPSTTASTVGGSFDLRDWLIELLLAFGMKAPAK